MEKVRTVERKTARGTLEVSYGPIRVTDIREHSFRNDCDQAELRQTVITHYPSARFHSSNIDPLFTLSEFSAQETTDYESERVIWINVPKGVTQQDLEDRLEKYPEATIYRILSHDVEQVLSKEQLFAMKSDAFPNATINSFKKSHCIMFPNEKTGMRCPVSSDGGWHPESVKLNMNGRIVEIINDEQFQYRSRGFSFEDQEDIDLRKPDSVAPLKEPPEVESVIVEEETGEVVSSEVVNGDEQPSASMVDEAEEVSK